MAVCENKKARTKKKGRRALVFLCVLLLFMVSGFVFFDRHITPIIADTATATVRAKVNSALNTCVFQSLAENSADYAQLIKIEKDLSGKIIFIDIDTLKLNVIARAAVLSSQQAVDALNLSGVELPWGTLSGITILSGRGSNVHIGIKSLSSVEADFVTELQRVGINQSKQKIYINLKCDISVILSSKTYKITCPVKVLISDCLILGEIPATYFNTSGLNLAP